MVGKSLSHYSIESKLGAGGMGDVYRARDTKLGREVALKVLPADLAQDPERRARFLREAQAVATLQHPNIVTMHSVDEVDGTFFLTMELIEGTTLDAVIPTHGLRVNQLLDLAIPIADAIAYAHQKGITHRDLKPMNVMVDTRKHVRVLDFGLAKLLEEPAAPDDGATLPVDKDATAEGHVLGTAAYMSPEQAQGLPVDQRTDIFSLGILLYEMATGRRPFEGDTRMSTISAVIKDEPQPISQLNAGLPRHLGRIIHKCLAKDPNSRYQTAQDLKIDLDGLKQETESGLESESHPAAAAPSTRVDNKPSGRPAWLIPAVVVAAIAAVIAVWQLFLGDRAQQATQTTPTPQATATQATATPIPLADRTLIAVLPFKNLGDPDDAYFADGVSEELMSRLAGIKSFGVISRQSAAKFADSDKTMTQIGQELGVEYIIDGSVRWQKSDDGAGRVRVTPHLTRAADDVQLWSERYDEDVADLFEVQTRIAQGIVAQLGAAIGQSDLTVESTEAPTENIEALRLYLRARKLMDGFSTPDARKEGMGLLRRALELDPEFGEAWAYLSQRISLEGLSGAISEEELAEARAAADRAMELDPGSIHAHLALGYYYYWGRKQYDRAYAEFEKTGELDSNPEVMDAAAYVLRRAGRWEESTRLLEQARILDPLGAWGELGESYRMMRRFEDADRAFRKHAEVNPDDLVALLVYDWQRYNWTGDLDPLKRTIAEFPDPDHPILVYAKGWLADQEGRYDDAIEYARAAPFPLMDHPSEWTPKSSEIYRAMWRAGRPGTEELEKALADYDQGIAESPRDYRRRVGRARILALAGRREEALRDIQMALDLSPISVDAINGRDVLLDQALIHLALGDVEKAVALLRDRLADPYSGVTPISLSQEDMVRRHLDHPAVQELLNQAP